MKTSVVIDADYVLSAARSLQIPLEAIEISNVVESLRATHSAVLIIESGPPFEATTPASQVR